MKGFEEFFAHGIRTAACLGILWLSSAGHAMDVDILSPQPGETIHENSGMVNVTVQAALVAGQRIRILLDGRPSGADSEAKSIALENVDRGEHSLQAQVLDNNAVVLGSSAAITFYLWRASSKLPPRKKTAPPPKKK